MSIAQSPRVLERDGKTRRGARGVFSFLLSGLASTDGRSRARTIATPVATHKPSRDNAGVVFPRAKGAVSADSDSAKAGGVGFCANAFR